MQTLFVRLQMLFFK